MDNARLLKKLFETKYFRISLLPDVVGPVYVLVWWWWGIVCVGGRGVLVHAPAYIRV